MTSGMVGRDGVGDRLEEHRLAGAGRRDDQAALALADRRDAGRGRATVMLRRLERIRSCGIERRQVVEEDLLARDVGVLEVDRLDLDQGEVALPFLGRADLAGDRVAGAQVELADLRRRDVDVVGARQVVVLGRAQEAEPVGQALEHALREDQPLLLGLRLQDLEDQVLLAHAGRVLDLQVLGDLQELRDLDLVERPDVERVAVLDRATSSPVVSGKPLRGRLRASRRRSRWCPFRLAICVSSCCVMLGG